MSMESAALKSTPHSRDTQIDTVKFLLIFSIFIFHFENAAGNFYPFSNIYQVSIFFLISGFWALNRLEKSFFQFICDALKKYLVYWFVWVLLYTAYYTIANSFTFSKSLELFIRYFSGVRATGIYGMWFTPAFFFVSLIYFLVAKGLSKIIKRSKRCLAWVCCSFCFLVYYVTKYFFVIPQDLIFSLGIVPEYLFYFSVGAVMHAYSCDLKEKLKTSAFLKITNYAIIILAFVYFMLHFFKKENVIWWWIPDVLGGKLSFISDLVTTLLVFFLVNFIAKCISCDFTVKIGRNTLGLCHCEAFVKSILVFTGKLLGLTINATNPIGVCIFSFVALAVGCYLVLPVTNMVTKRMFSLEKKP